MKKIFLIFLLSLVHTVFAGDHVFDTGRLLEDIKKVEYEDRLNSLYLKKGVKIIFFLENSVSNPEKYFFDKSESVRMAGESVLFLIAKNNSSIFYLVGENNFAKFDDKYCKYLKKNSEKKLKKGSLDSAINFLIYDIDMNLGGSKIPNFFRQNRAPFIVLFILSVVTIFSFILFKGEKKSRR